MKPLVPIGNTCAVSDDTLKSYRDNVLYLLRCHYIYIYIYTRCGVFKVFYLQMPAAVFRFNVCCPNIYRRNMTHSSNFILYTWFS